MSDSIQTGNAYADSLTYRAIDVGFDLRLSRPVPIAIVLPHVGTLTVDYDGKDGPERVHGTRAYVARKLRQAGYTVTLQAREER